MKQKTLEDKKIFWEKVHNNAHISIFVIIIIMSATLAIVLYNFGTNPFLEEGSNEFEILKSEATTIYETHIQGLKSESSLGYHTFTVSDAEIVAKDTRYFGEIKGYYDSNGELKFQSSSYSEYMDYKKKSIPVGAILGIMVGVLFGMICFCAIINIAEYRLKKYEKIKQSECEKDEV